MEDLNIKKLDSLEKRLRRIQKIVGNDLLALRLDTSGIFTTPQYKGKITYKDMSRYLSFIEKKYRIISS